MIEDCSAGAIGEAEPCTESVGLTVDMGMYSLPRSEDPLFPLPLPQHRVVGGVVVKRGEVVVNE